MRSLLFVPADSKRKLDRARQSEADALILDLEDSVVPANRPAARAQARAFLAEAPEAGFRRYVRINPLASGVALEDLAAVLPAKPDGILLPKCSPEEIRSLDHYLSAFEAAFGLTEGAVRVVAIATETPAAMFSLGGLKSCERQLGLERPGLEEIDGYLAVLLWRDYRRRHDPRTLETLLAYNAQDTLVLEALMVEAYNRKLDGSYDDVYRLARALCLLAAADAEVMAIDTIYTDFKDEAGLAAECSAARRSGFVAKMAIHPAQLSTINRAFSASAEELAWARRIVAVFAENPGAGTIALDGKMVDKPHLTLARRLLGLGKEPEPAASS